MVALISNLFIWIPSCDLLFVLLLTDSWVVSIFKLLLIKFLCIQHSLSVDIFLPLYPEEGIPGGEYFWVIVLVYILISEITYSFSKIVVLFYAFAKNEVCGCFTSFPKFGVVLVRNFSHSGSCADTLIYI